MNLLLMEFDKDKKIYLKKLNKKIKKWHGTEVIWIQLKNWIN